MSSDAARTLARVLGVVTAREINPLTLESIARTMDVPLDRVMGWAHGERVPSHAAEVRLAALVRGRLVASEALALGLHIGPGDRVWAHAPSRRRR